MVYLLISAFFLVPLAILGSSAWNKHLAAQRLKQSKLHSARRIRPSTADIATAEAATENDRKVRSSNFGRRSYQRR